MKNLPDFQLADRYYDIKGLAYFLSKHAFSL